MSPAGCKPSAIGLEVRFLPSTPTCGMSTYLNWICSSKVEQPALNRQARVRSPPDPRDARFVGLRSVTIEYRYEKRMIAGAAQADSPALFNVAQPRQSARLLSGEMRVRFPPLEPRVWLEQCTLGQTLFVESNRPVVDSLICPVLLAVRNLDFQSRCWGSTPQRGACADVSHLGRGLVVTQRRRVRFPYVRLAVMAQW